MIVYWRCFLIDPEILWRDYLKVQVSEKVRPEKLSGENVMAAAYTGCVEVWSRVSNSSGNSRSL
jgi:hypothetical protein